MIAAQYLFLKNMNTQTTKDVVFFTVHLRTEIFVFQ